MAAVLHICGRISVFGINVMLYKRTLLFSNCSDLFISGTEQPMSAVIGLEVDLTI